MMMKIVYSVTIKIPSVFNVLFKKERGGPFSFEIFSFEIFSLWAF